MELTISTVNVEGYDYMSIQDFIDKYHPGLSVQAVHYCCRKDKVDFIKPGRERLIVLTEKTLSYKPLKYDK